MIKHTASYVPMPCPTAHSTAFGLVGATVGDRAVFFDGAAVVRLLGRFCVGATVGAGYTTRGRVGILALPVRAYMCMWV